MSVVSWLFRQNRFVRFACVGILNTLAHGIVLVFSVEKLKVDATVANLYAFVVANALSYILNSYFTFCAKLSLFRYVKFFISSLLALGLTLMISWLAQRSGIHYFFGFLMIVILVPLFSYFVMQVLVFDMSVVHESEKNE